jgi:hypothetical protein
LLYGDDIPGFSETVKKWLYSKQGSIEPGYYNLRGGEYSDTLESIHLQAPDDKEEILEWWNKPEEQEGAKEKIWILTDNLADQINQMNEWREYEDENYQELPERKEFKRKVDLENYKNSRWIDNAAFDDELTYQIKSEFENMDDEELFYEVDDKTWKWLGVSEEQREAFEEPEGEMEGVLPYDRDELIDHLTRERVEKAFSQRWDESESYNDYSRNFKIAAGNYIAENIEQFSDELALELIEEQRRGYSGRKGMKDWMSLIIAKKPHLFSKEMLKDMTKSDRDRLFNVLEKHHPEQAQDYKSYWIDNISSKFSPEGLDRFWEIFRGKEEPTGQDREIRLLSFSSTLQKELMELYGLPIGEKEISYLSNFLGEGVFKYGFEKPDILQVSALHAAKHSHAPAVLKDKVYEEAWDYYEGYDWVKGDKISIHTLGDAVERMIRTARKQSPEEAKALEEKWGRRFLSELRMLDRLDPEKPQDGHTEHMWKLILRSSESEYHNILSQIFGYEKYNKMVESGAIPSKKKQ